MYDEIKSLEHSTLKVPYETLNKQYRNVQKAIDRDCSSMSQQLNQIDKIINKNDFTKEDLVKFLSNLVEKLKNLKRRSIDLRNDEKDLLKLIKKRIDHLKDCESTTQNSLRLYRRQRVDRMLIDYFLRCGFYETAQELATKSKIQDMTNIDIFLIEKDIVDSLKNRDTSKCLAWCNEHKSKLKKVNSNLEFMLRQQEFIEMVRTQKCIDAVHHARKYFVNLTPQQLVDVQKSMVLLAYVKSSDSSVYQELLNESRWDFLIDIFKSDNYKIHQLPQTSSFNAVLQAGLSALKTPTCFRKVQSIKNPNCPVCQTNLNTIAKPLPYAHCSNSKLICASSGEALNEHNIPMMLPNGFVYGHNVIYNFTVYFLK